MIKPFGCEIGDIAENVIITPFLSIKKIAENLDKIEKEFKGFYFYKGLTGIYQDKRITLISTSVGPTSVGDAVLFLGACPQIKKIVFAGSAGLLKDNVAIGEVFAVSEAVGGGDFEKYLSLLPGNIEKYLSLSNKYSPNADLLGRAKDLGRIKTLSIGSIAFETEENLKKLKEIGTEALDLETASFYAACAKISVEKYLSLVFVSDLPLKQEFFAGLIKKDQKLMPVIVNNFQKIVLDII